MSIIGKYEVSTRQFDTLHEAINFGKEIMIKYPGSKPISILKVVGRVSMPRFDPKVTLATECLDEDL